MRLDLSKRSLHVELLLVPSQSHPWISSLMVRIAVVNLFAVVNSPKMQRSLLTGSDRKMVHAP
jgi:hypothetical protein